jgi:antitoxin (DNA-binding transcriptional repressor) of toxin-antitoxin stability system
VAGEVLILDIRTIPQLREVVDEVRRTGRPVAIQEDGEEIARIAPARPPRRRRALRGKPITADDPIWKIVGMGRSEGPGDVSENKYKYLVEAKLAKMR